MRERWRDFKAALREMFEPTWDHEDEADLDADTAARTRWVRDHRHPDGGEPT